MAGQINDEYRIIRCLFCMLKEKLRAETDSIISVGHLKRERTQNQYSVVFYAFDVIVQLEEWGSHSGQ